MNQLNLIRAQEQKKQKQKLAKVAFVKNACTGKACAC